MFNWDTDDWVLFIPIGIVLSVLVLLFMAISSDATKKQRLMQQCMGDGHKEYECEAMLKTDSHSTYIPIHYPSGR